MSKARVAESVLTVAVGAKRASEITGDLLEQGRQVNFWWTIFTIVVGASWRWALAIASSGVVTLFLLTRYAAATQAHLEQRIQISWGVLCIMASLCTFTVVVLNSFRFGVRNRVNAVGLPLAALLLSTAWVASNLQWTHVGISLTLGYLLVCLLARSTRREMLCVLAPASVYALCFWGFLQFMSGPDKVPQFVLAAEFFGFWFISFICEARSLVFAKRVLLAR